MRTFEFKLMTAGDMSQSSLTTTAQNLDQMFIASIQANWTGSPVGTIILQVSNDNLIWSDYTGSLQNVNGAGNYTWLLGTVSFGYLKAVYTKTSGTGSLGVTVYGKG